jgi:hypothetical protein
LPMKAHVTRSKTKLRFIFELKLKSKWLSVFCGSILYDPAARLMREPWSSGDDAHAP